MALVFAAPDPVSLPVADSADVVPVGRVWCVGRNYADHAREMGHDPDREPPFFFAKPASAVVACPTDETVAVHYPTLTANLHHEVELAVVIGTRADGVSVDDALSHVWGYGVSIDLTRRDVQDEAKHLRRPWDLSKGFDESAPISAISPVSVIGHPVAGRIMLAVDGQIRQDGDLDQQIWNVAEIVSILSHAVVLLPGDVILTGTPSGVGALSIGDTVAAEIAGVATLSVRVTERNM